MEDNKLTIISDTGEEQLAEILFTHEENGIDYVVFEFEESGDITAARYIEGENGEGELVDIETDEEWAMLDALVEEYFDELDDEDSEDESEN